MAEILPLIQGDRFDQEAISILSEALKMPGTELRRQGSSLARPAYARPCAKSWPSTSLRKLSVANMTRPNSASALSAS